MQLKHVCPQAKIIAMTSGARKKGTASLVTFASLQLGAQHMLMKPFTKQSLLDAISTVLHPKERTGNEEFQAEIPVSQWGMP